MKLTTFLSLLSAAFSIVASCYTIIHFMDNGEEEKKNIQEVNEVEKENDEKNTTDYQDLHEDYQDDVHLDIYQYIKKTKEEEENEVKKEKSHSMKIAFLIKSISFLTAYLILALALIFYIKNKKREDYPGKIAKKDIVPKEIKSFFLKKKDEDYPVSSTETADLNFSLFGSNVLFDFDSYPQYFFMEMVYVTFGFYILTDLLELLISFLFAFFKKDQKKSFFRRWKEVIFSLQGSFSNQQLPIFRVISQVLIHFVNLSGLYFMFRIVVYGVDRYNTAHRPLGAGIN